MTYAKNTSLPLVVTLLLVASPFLSPFFFPSSLLIDTGYHDNQRLIELLLLIITPLMAGVACLQSSTDFPFINKKVTTFLALFFLLGLISSVLSRSPRHALYEWSSYLLLFFLAWLVAGAISRDAKQLIDKVLRLCGYGSALYIFNVFVIYVGALSSGGQSYPYDFIHGFDNPRFFNHIQTITLPLLALLLVRDDSSVKRRIFWWIVISFWWALIFLSSGRGVFIALVSGTLVAFLFLGRSALPWCRNLVLSCITGFLTYEFFFVLIPSVMGVKPFAWPYAIISRTVIAPDSGRWQLWTRAIEIINQHPWLGVGPLHYAYLDEKAPISAHPHNWPLQLASEWGIPALALLIVVAVIAFKGLLRSRKFLSTGDASSQATLTTWIAIVASVTTDTMVSGITVMPTSQLWIALFLGCGWGWVASIKSRTEREASKSPRFTSSIIFVCATNAAIALGFSVWPEIFHLSAQERGILKADPSRVLYPRIWRVGHFH